ncbi:uncharacterized protein LOC112597501 [Melanaphis sacchari]|uniref:uncharacterized protein LOC112597501 n=1 Tax=Melanaphis sacchari TaxID=742174 RepID=UPI000DC142B7|nr:uncharacterized protein LOC112597501 [Melanaphis sacchari]
MARVSEIWIIKIINGIIEFDRALDGLSLTVLEEFICSTAKYNWNIFLAALLTSYISLQIFSIWLWPPARFNFNTIVKYFFEIPCIIDFVIFATAYFYLQNLGSRFEILNRFCKRLPDALIITAGTWTQSKITQLIENVRLLHAELCELLRVFNQGYGVLMLFYFVFNFFDLLRNFYYLLHISRYSSSKIIVNFTTLNIILMATFCLQNIFFVILLLISVSWINKKKMEVVSFLRLIHISKLPFDTKLQIKMFMNQLSYFEWDQISAFGFFRMDLKYIISFFILLTAILATSVQMKKHPYVVRFNNAYHSYLKLEYLNMHEYDV